MLSIMALAFLCHLRAHWCQLQHWAGFITRAERVKKGKIAS